MAHEDEKSLVTIPQENRLLIGILSDKESTLGFLLAGVGQRNLDGTNNYMMVDDDTPTEDIEKFFHNLYHRPNIYVILVAFDIMKKMSGFFAKYTKTVPIIVTIPTKTTINQYTVEKEKQRRQQRWDSA